MRTKAPMTAAEALEIIAIMRRKTPPDAFRRVLEMALGRFGNLSPEARAVYQDELSRTNTIGQ